MVKKGPAQKGKDDKGSSKDSFDPVLVDSWQASTCVLMLDSAEDDVVIKATEAIYKYVEKRAENKLQLLQLNCLPRLVKLIGNENRTIRRDAVLVLGSLSKHPDAVGKAMKDMDLIPTFVRLLGPEEETTVNEYSALCLIALAKYFSCKRIICENKGVEVLVRGLSSTDPDFQKNIVELMSLLMEGFEAKTLIREVSGLLPIIDLLKSEYAVIQTLALTTLKLATEDGLNRAALRETTLIVELLNIISSPSFSDIHALAVSVLHNICQDFESIQLMKDSGTLRRLLLVMMDILPPVVEEEKKTKAKDRDKVQSASKLNKKKEKSTDCDSA